MQPIAIPTYPAYRGNPNPFYVHFAADIEVPTVTARATNETNVTLALELQPSVEVVDRLAVIEFSADQSNALPSYVRLVVALDGIDTFGARLEPTNSMTSAPTGYVLNPKGLDLRINSLGTDVVGIADLSVKQTAELLAAALQAKKDAADEKTAAQTAAGTASNKAQDVVNVLNEVIEQKTEINTVVASAVGSAQTAGQHKVAAETAAETAIIKAFQTANDVLATAADRIQVAADKNTTITAKNEAVAAANNANLGLIPKGSWNPVTNNPALTATPNPAFVDGSYYDIVFDSGSGTIPFAGQNFTVGQVVTNGDRLKKIGTQWMWIKHSDLALSRIDTIEPDLYIFPGQETGAGKSYLSGNWYYNEFGNLTAGFTYDKGSEDYVPIIGGADYRYIGRLTDIRGIVFYDANKVKLSWISPGIGNVWTDRAFTAPANAAFLRSSVYSTTINGFQILYNGPRLKLFATKEEKTALQSDINSLGSRVSAEETISANLSKIALWPDKVVSNAASSTFVQGGYFESSGAIGTVGGNSYSYQSNYIPVGAGKPYLYTGSLVDSRFIIFYDAAKSVMGYATKPGGTVTSLAFTTPAGCAFIRCSCTTSAIATFSIVSKVEAPEAIVPTTTAAIDYNLLTPEFVFAIDNDGSFFNREYAVNLYPEGLVREKVPVLFDGISRSMPLQNNEKNTLVKSITAKSFSLSYPGYVTKTGSVNFVKTKASNAKSKPLRLLICGDSLSAANLQYPDGSIKGGWSFPSLVRELGMKDNIDQTGNLINVQLLGTRNNITGRSFDYKGTNYPVRSFCEGQGGRTAANLLRHAAFITARAGGQYSPECCWDMLGLKTAQGRAFSNSAADQNLIMKTVQGAYHWDYTAILYAGLGGTGTYTGSTVQNALIDTAMNNILDFPDNRFYDRAKAETPGATSALSVSTYLSRYKTLSDVDGTTRLIVGSTAGSRVSDASSTDVCTATHMIIELGENDRWFFSLAPSEAVDTLMGIKASIHSEYPSMILGFANSRMVGPLYPERWRDKGIFQGMSVVNNVFKYDVQSLLKDQLGNLDAQVAAKTFLLPAYHTMSVTSFSQNRLVTNLEDMSDIQAGNTDINHPGIAGSTAIAYQILAWMYYTV